MIIQNKINLIGRFDRGGRTRQNKGFTLIEVVIYCSIFIIFAVTTIESMIWIGAQLSTQANVAEIQEQDIYKIYFSNIYRRTRMNNQKVETLYSTLISSSSRVCLDVTEDCKMNIILNSDIVTKFNHKNRYQSDLLFFDSIDNGV
jgi:uncharacterized protein (UPF0333 family)